MTNADYPVYDFASAGSVPRSLTKAYQPWLSKFAESFVDRWRDFSPARIEIQITPATSRTFRDEQKRWADVCVGMPIRVDTTNVPGLLIANRQDLLRLLMQVLGGDPAEKILDRTLTTVELSLSQLVFETVAATLAESWPHKEPLSIGTDSMDVNPGRNRMFEPEQEVILAGITIIAAAGKTTIQWLLPKESLAQLLDVKLEVAAPNTGLPKIPIENIAGLEVTVSAQLGTALLNMSQLMSMSAGDIVALNQTVNSPILLSVNDQPLFEAWPGRVGNQQCLRVESLH